MGVLMCGISVSALFAIATRLVGNEGQLSGRPILAESEDSADWGAAARLDLNSGKKILN
jgi:hypothetical protein